MSKIERYQGNVQAFASAAQGVERTVFGGTEQANDLTSQITAAFLRGWGVVGPSEHPSLEDFNAAMYAMSQFIAYQHQAGIPEWHEEQEYYAGSVCTHAGVSYQSLEDANTGHEPPSTHWTPVITENNGSEYYQSLNKTLTMLAALTGAADKLPYFNGDDTATLTALTAVGRDIIGKATITDVLSYLGLGAGGFPIGMPFFWPSATLPNLLLPEWSNMVFLKFNNSSFSGTTYPKLAQIFPSLVLPDARGDFPRIWDDGRGKDAGRALLSEQGDAIRNISGYADLVYGQAAGNRTGPFFNSNTPPERYYATLSASGVDSYPNIGFDAGRVVPVASENRPVNIAFNLLVRAA